MKQGSQSLKPSRLKIPISTTPQIMTQVQTATSLRDSNSANGFFKFTPHPVPWVEKSKALPDRQALGGWVKHKKRITDVMR